jgi:hypothetical protein
LVALGLARIVQPAAARSANTKPSEERIAATVAAFDSVPDGFSEAEPPVQARH